MLAAVPNNRTEVNADYYDKMIKLNKEKRFCGNNYHDDGYGKDAFKQRYCKNFEVKQLYKGNVITKNEAIEMSKSKTKK